MQKSSNVDDKVHPSVDQLQLNDLRVQSGNPQRVEVNYQQSLKALNNSYTVITISPSNPEPAGEQIGASGLTNEESLDRLFKTTSENAKKLATDLQLSLATNKKVVIVETTIQAEVQKCMHLKDMEKLASGGYGTVWTAKDNCRSEKDSKSFAIKTMLTCYEDKDFKEKIFLRNFKREDFCLRTFSQHPNVVDYFESTLLFDGSVAAIKMELLDGSLESEAKVSSIPLPVLVRLIKQIGSALCFLHERNYAHHDIKLANIGITKSSDGERSLASATFKLIDFGLVKKYQENQPFEPKFRGGTLLFNAPEKTRIEQPYNPYLADAYAFGLTLLFATFGFRTSTSIVINFKAKMRAVEGIICGEIDQIKYKRPHGIKSVLDMRAVARYIYQTHESLINVGNKDPIMAKQFMQIVFALIDDERESETRPARITIAEAMKRCEEMLNSLSQCSSPPSPPE